MSRIQLALNVSDIDEAIAFYSKLFAAEPAKVRPGYANFAIEDPPLKLVLIESEGAETRLNHLGVEVPQPADVTAATARLADQGLEAEDGSGTCCYAVQEKVWVHDPDGAAWEVYAVVADAPTFAPPAELQDRAEGDRLPSACCTEGAGPEPAATVGCC